jgi:hypothetical protein
MTVSWNPAGDHIIFDRLESLVCTQPDGVTFTIANSLRLPGSLQNGPAGTATIYGTQFRFNLWVLECAQPPKLHAKLVDANGQAYRVDNVTLSVSRNMYEVDATGDAGESLVVDVNHLLWTDGAENTISAYIDPVTETTTTLDYE